MVNWDETKTRVREYNISLSVSNTYLSAFKLDPISSTDLSRSLVNVCLECQTNAMVISHPYIEDELGLSHPVPDSTHLIHWCDTLPTVIKDEMDICVWSHKLSTKWAQTCINEEHSWEDVRDEILRENPQESQQICLKNVNKWAKSSEKSAHIILQGFIDLELNSWANTFG
ncbi:hypothetical protein AAMO2058_001010400 [Amorphochlora amoebiformis]